MQEPCDYECLCLQCGLTYAMAPADLILEQPPDADYPIATNVFCEACGGALGALDAPCDPNPDPDEL